MKYMHTFSAIYSRSLAADVKICNLGLSRLRKCLSRHISSASSAIDRHTTSTKRSYLSTSPGGVESVESMKDAFIYHQRVNILEEKKQSCYLTKSILKPGLPERFHTPLDYSEEEIAIFMKEFEQNIINSRLFCYGESPYHRKETSSLQIFLNMLHIVWKNNSNRSGATNY